MKRPPSHLVKLRYNISMALLQKIFTVMDMDLSEAVAFIASNPHI